jgi:hypothetical protein
MITRRAAIQAVALLALGTPVTAQTPASRYNFLDGINLPTAQQDEMTRQVAEQLKTTAVPTTKDAIALGWSAGTVAAYEIVRVSGLYVVGVDVPGFANARDLAWEVRIYTGPGIRRVLWVSTTTKAVKVLFGPDL